MLTPKLAISTSRTDERICLTLAGEVDLSTRDALINASIRALAEPITRLEFDVSGLRFCDSSGISGFLAIRRIAEEQGIAVVLTNVSPQLEQMLAVTGLYEHLTADGPSPDSGARLHPVPEPDRFSEPDA